MGLEERGWDERRGDGIKGEEMGLEERGWD